jgi:hypothetical protein
MKKQLLQESLRYRFDKLNYAQARHFNDLVIELNNTYKFDKDWLNELINDFEFEFKMKWIN